MDTRKNLQQREFREESLVRLFAQTIFTIFIVIVLVIFFGYVIREEIVNISKELLNIFGYPGLLVGMFLSDSLPAFIPPDAFLMISIAAEMNSLGVLFFTSLGSILGGLVAYGVGRFLVPKFSIGRQIVLRYEDRLLPYIKTYGFWAVVLSALTPIPFSWMAYTVGTFKMNPILFFFGACFRIPRMVIYYYAILWGWIQ